MLFSGDQLVRAHCVKFYVLFSRHAKLTLRFGVNGRSRPPPLEGRGVTAHLRPCSESVGLSLATLSGVWPRRRRSTERRLPTADPQSAKAKGGLLCHAATPSRSSMMMSRIFAKTNLASSPPNSEADLPKLRAAQDKLARRSAFQY
jgi:hypothetical protein